MSTPVKVATRPGLAILRQTSPPDPGSAGLAEWSGALLRVRIGQASASNPGVTILAQTPAHVTGEPLGVDCGKLPAKPAARGVLYVIARQWLRNGRSIPKDKENEVKATQTDTPST